MHKQQYIAVTNTRNGNIEVVRKLRVVREKVKEMAFPHYNDLNFPDYEKEQNKLERWQAITLLR